LSLLDRLLKLESVVRYKQPAPSGQRPFQHILGHLPILVSAPHGTAHRRQGKLKGEEEYTAALAQLLAAQTGAHALFANHQSENDPNWDRHSPYKSHLASLVTAHDIRFVIDLHGMSNRYKVGMALGTINGRSCPQHEPAIIDLLQTFTFTQATYPELRRYPTLNWDHFVLNHPRFTGGLAQHTVTRFVSEGLRIPALQVELCSSVRVVQRGKYGRRPSSFRGDPAGIQQVVTTLTALVQHLDIATLKDSSN